MSALWAVKRRSLYVLGTIVFLALLGVGAWFFFFNEAPSCFDGVQNQDEAGIDCGGACKKVCTSQVTEPVVLWSRALPVSEGRFHAIAYIENPNGRAGAREISYTFELYDSSGVPIAERSGATYLIPNGTTPVFEANIPTGERVPTQTFFDFRVTSDWERTRERGNPFTVGDKRLSGVDSNPRLDAKIANTTNDALEDVEVVAVILNANQNAIAVSRTVLDHLPPRAAMDVVYTWPRPLKKELEACVVPADIMVAMDVSGSMNDDQEDPPQPLTDAVTAAADFIGRLAGEDRVGLVAFATDASIVQTLTDNFSAATGRIRSLAIDPAQQRGATNIGAAIREAHRELGAARPEERKKAVVLLTDGLANAPEDPGGEVYAAQQGNVAKGNRISIYTIGLGDSVNEAFLRQLASQPTQYYQAASSGDLDGIYQQISASICERGPAIIDIIPRSKDAYFTD